MNITYSFTLSSTQNSNFFVFHYWLFWITTCSCLSATLDSSTSQPGGALQLCTLH